ncbi:MAG: hypothetical protein TREMPRED_005725, partial [Tremellales sp. Tagirdzhanova-0007]
MKSTSGPSYTPPNAACEPMPIHPSAHLLTVGARHRALSGKLAEERELSLRRTQDHCDVHEWETSVIPLGIWDDFGGSIDILKISERLIQGWIGEELASLADHPEKSPIKDVMKEIDKMGKGTWRSVMTHDNMWIKTDQTIRVQ